MVSGRQGVIRAQVIGGRNQGEKGPRVEWYRFDVVDTGIGIAEKDLENIFQPFHQVTRKRNAEGMGLGLAIVKHHVELMGGCLEVTSELGKGSCFCVKLPLFRELSAGAAPDPELGATRLQDGYCLKAVVVDDVPENCDLFSRMLKQMGCIVHAFDNAPDAIAFIEIDPPQVVFMDIRMPGMDGVEAVRRIRALFEGEENEGRGKVPRLIAVSAFAKLAELQEYLKHGFDEFIVKPVYFPAIDECLSHVPGVRMAKNAENDQVNLEAVELEFGVPEELLDRLEKAARFYRLTEFKQCLQELRNRGPAADRLADRLRNLYERTDRGALWQELSRLRSPSPLEEETSCQSKPSV